MNFFEQQDKARARSRWLIFLFILAVIGVVASVNAAVYFGYLRWQPQFALEEHIRLFVGISTLMVATIVLSSVYKFYSLSSGGSAVALMLGGQPISRQTQNSHERVLLNLVEEMAIASGVPVPEVFVLNGQRGINAFAAGFNQKDAVIAVTRGALTHLNRDELQGVIAHEFSHILNSDTRLHMQLLGFATGIAVLAYTGRMLMQSVRGSRSGRNKGGSQIFLLGLFLFLMGWIGVFFAHIIKAAVSRQREYLADASAVQFTRNPDGIGGALKKIGGAEGGSAVICANIEEANHFFFSEVEGEGGGWLSSHPPLMKRILAIDPRFDGHFPEIKLEEAPSPALVMTAYDQKVAQKKKSQGVDPERWMATIGTLAMTSVQLTTSIDDKIRQRASDPYQSQNIFYALFLSSEERYLKIQMDFLSTKLEATALREIEDNRKVFQRLDANSFHLPILNLTLPSLRAYSDAQFKSLVSHIKVLCDVDQQLTVLEYASCKLIQNYRRGLSREKLVIQYYALEGVKNDILVLLSAIAYAACGQTKEALDSFAAGTRVLKLFAFTPFAPEACGLLQMDHALERLRRTSPMLKQKIIHAAMHSALWNGKVNQNEVALLQVAAAVMDVPLGAVA